ncbi:MAG: thiolase family protein [Deltaproteobacteria bacterium]|nr:MAG: thiolase family protein [Deltaproteobacteria bacterium]
MSDVYIAGVGMTRFNKYPEKSIKQLTAEALEAVLKDVSVNKDQIEAAWFSNSGWGMSQDQHCIRSQVALTPQRIQGIPMMNVENACAGGSSAIHGAWMSIKAGLYDVVLAVGAEKVYFPEDRKKMFEGFISGTDVEVTKAIIEMMKEEAKKKAEELKKAGKLKDDGKQKDRSAFMDIYAMGARMHMEKYGSTQRQLAVIAAKNHFHGSLNPYAQYQMDMTVEEVLQDRLVSYPLTRAMCAPIGDGAAAAILCSSGFLKKIKNARPVRIRASVLASGRIRGSDEPPIGARLSKRAYEMSGLEPDDINVAEVHDATAFGELIQCEELGFCPEGEGGVFAESGATKLGGKLPINPSGGLECRGHPIGASGIAQITEMVMQLRGEADKRQVDGARIALTENGGGFIGTEEAAMTIHILEKV